MQLAIEALENFEIIKRSIGIIKQERSLMYTKLNQIDKIKTYCSDANFLFFQTFNHFNKIKERLFQEKILIKDFGNIGDYKGAIRATIGTKEMNYRLLSTIEQST
jgi:histidinol-phosphate aminotransferase